MKTPEPKAHLSIAKTVEEVAKNVIRTLEIWKGKP